MIPKIQKKLRICKDCGKLSENRGHGLCWSCYYGKNREIYINRGKKHYWNNRKHHLKRIKDYSKTHKKKINKRNKIYRNDPSKREIILKGKRRYRIRHREKIRVRERERVYKRRRIDINFRIRCNLRARIHYAVKGKPKSKRTIKLIGCSIEYLLDYLESQFDDEMSWSNYGKWEIDHIKPCAKFDLTKEEEQEKCFNYSNLQPLWKIDNIMKSAT